MFTEAIKNNSLWMTYKNYGGSLHPLRIMFFKTPREAVETAKQWADSYSGYGVMPAPPLYKSLKAMMRMESFGFVRAVSLEFDPGVLTMKYLKDHKLPADLLTIKIEKKMNDKNLEYLEKQLKFTGFGEGYTEQLKTKMAAGTPEFVLSHETKYGKDEVMAALQFRKSDNSDMYFFNRYNLMLKNEQHPDPIKQTFYINNNQDNITLKEGYNMIAGRAVQKTLENKEGEKYKAWVQLDFKESDTHGNYKAKYFNENYGFRLDEVLGKHPFKELQSPEEKQKLMDSLQRGNKQMVTLEAEGKSIKLYIEAAPQYKSLNYYDSSGKRMQTHEISNAVKQTNGKEQQQERAKVTQSPGGDDDIDGPKKSRSRRQSV